MSFSLRRLLGVGIDANKRADVRDPVLLENVKAAPAPDQELEEEASKLSRQLAHGFMVMNKIKTAAQVRAELSAAALNQMDRRPN